jgi:hypothetical protein
MGEPVSDPRDDESVSIEADAPEADWIEQHQAVVDEDDGESFAAQVRDDTEPVGIEADAPEADWIEQHQPVVEEPDEDLRPSEGVPEELDADASEEDAEAWEEWNVTDDEGTADEPTVVPPTRSADEREPPPAPAGGRGCNVVAALLHLALRSGRELIRQLAAGRQPGSRG